MQFAIIVEFLLPGLAAVLLTFGLVPHGVEALQHAMDKSKEATTLALLVVSYPVVILTNFPIFEFFQVPWVMPRARRRVLETFRKKGVDLFETVKRFGVPAQEPRDLFQAMRAVVFRENIVRFNANHLYHEGLQRLARGVLVPLVLGIIMLMQHDQCLLALVSVLLFGVALRLLFYSIEHEEEELVRYFLVIDASRTAAANRARSASRIA